MKKLMTVVLAMLFAASTGVVFAAEGKDAKKDEKKAEAKKDEKKAEAKKDGKGDAKKDEKAKK